ncbi:dTMP kinase [Ferrimonas balearica]|uniref:dTMP kinase n=1 Tax=Ferrimonas balearica TaxID=44012 RepID=UPI001F2BA9DB|nr:dTMP kinase [Ferrimonas balearica]MBY6016550.1 dTMP kinase [Halomonas denitrificans]MBY6095179.1 dTMP kinase [Ferrimonas balearica]
MTEQGTFIVIEGLEGAGKSTAIAVVDQYLKQRFPEREIVHTREPGGTPLAEEIRAIWKQPREEAMAPMTELLMVYACRAQLVESVIKPALARGAIVVGDRHDLSSKAYQGGGRGLAEPVARLSALTLGDFAPDLTLYLDIDPAIGLARARARGELDRIEQEALAFFQRARATYQAEAAADPRIVTIDAGQTLEQVHQSLINALDAGL